MKSFAFLPLALLGKEAAGLHRSPGLNLRGERLSSLPLHLFETDCSRRKASGAPAGNPGAVAVLKDGFFEVGCFDDAMYTSGDKYGDNKFQYTSGESTNATVVLYETFVPKKDRVPMSHTVCFAFCRTVPGMSFFGIRNGRDCYCMPFFQSVEGDDSICDSVCDGNKAATCGSKTKSSVFGMHSCNTLQADLSFSKGKLGDVSTKLNTLVGNLTSLESSFNGFAFWQMFAGVNGDPTTSKFMQDAKVMAGRLEGLRNASTKMLNDSASLRTAAGNVSDFTTAGGVAAAEGLVEKIEAATARTSAQVMEIEALLKQVNGDPAARGNGKSYYNAMYFVDKNFTTQYSACSGAPDRVAMKGSLDSCARACDDAFQTCVGFQFYNVPSAGISLCFFLSKLETVMYTTTCPAATESQSITCYARLSEFQDTSLKPDPSGKCQKCFKEATQRNCPY